MWLYCLYIQYLNTDNDIVYGVLYRQAICIWGSGQTGMNLNKFWLVVQILPHVAFKWDLDKSIEHQWEMYRHPSYFFFKMIFQIFLGSIVLNNWMRQMILTLFPGNVAMTCPCFQRQPVARWACNIHPLYSRGFQALSNHLNCIPTLSNQESPWEESWPITIEDSGTNLNLEQTLPVLVTSKHTRERPKKPNIWSISDSSTGIKTTPAETWSLRLILKSMVPLYVQLQLC